MACFLSYGVVIYFGVESVCSEKRREYIPVGSTKASMPSRISEQALSTPFNHFAHSDDVVLVFYRYRLAK